MLGTQPASALRRLYERFRTASAASLSLLNGKPGEWLRVVPGTSEADALQEAIGRDPSLKDSSESLKALAVLRLNDQIGAEHEMDVRLSWFRQGSSKTVHVRFFLAKPGKKNAGKAAQDRRSLPPALGTQMSLMGDAESADSGIHNSDSVGPKNAPEGQNDPDGIRVDKGLDGLSEPAPPEAPVAQIPDLAHLLDPASFEAALEVASVEDDSEIGRLLAEVVQEVLEAETELDPSVLIENMQRSLSLAQLPDPTVDVAQPEPQDWHTTSRQVVKTTVDLVRSYRGSLGRLAILAPSPGTGKTHGMAEAARDEQGVGRRVGYAVLSREQIPEACDRIKAHSPFIRLQVIEGRHEGNCANYDSVQTAAGMGYSPGQTVCPDCHLYPNLRNPIRSLPHTCEYYASRIRAVRDRKIAETARSISAYAAPIIVTTHASLAIGTQLSNRRLQGFWTFDTIFVDEDPTGSMEQQVEIWDHQLTYQWINPQTQAPDAHTLMTRLLRSAFAGAKAERREAHLRGYKNPSDASAPDPTHHRDHGSSYAGQQLLELLERSANALGYDLQTVLAQVVNESSVKVPRKGELMGADPKLIAKRYPHRWLSAMSQQLLNEVTARDVAVSEGIANPDFAYKIHADLVLEEGSDPSTPGKAHGVIRLHQAIPFAARESNVVVGDAYADVGHYEYLFDRFRRKGQVDVVNHRAKWPPSSVLVRLITKISSADFAEKDRFLAHLEEHVRPILALESGRTVLLYTHLATKEWLAEWMQHKSVEFDLKDWAVEHWGSGRGKDGYRDFDTFMAVTEFVPNTGGLVHEANARVLSANPGAPRVRFWGWGSERTGKTTFAGAMAAAHPALLSAFERKATDELAQAVHRIRPAIPAARQKRAWVLGHQVPLSGELLAATSATVALDEGGMGMTYATESLDRGMRLESNQGILGFVSAREMATAIGEVYRQVGCWSHVFCHALLAEPSCADLCQLLEGAWYVASTHERGDCSKRDQGEQTPRSSPPTLPPPTQAVPPRPSPVPPSPDPGPLWGRLADRVAYPPTNWPTLEQRVRWSWVYRQALRLFLSDLPSNLIRGSVRRPWMPAQSHGVECFGNPLRLERLIDNYAPTRSEVPF